MEKNLKRKAFIQKELRKASLKWPPRYACLKNSRVGRGLYKCTKCGGVFKGKEVQVDHIDPVISVKDGFVDYNTYIERLFCELAGYNTLCVFCHSAKSDEENSRRKK